MSIAAGVMAALPDFDAIAQNLGFRHFVVAAEIRLFREIILAS